MLNALLHAKEEVSKQKEIIEEQNKTLLQYSKQVEQNTVLQERNRISSELQHSVSRTFATLILQIESASSQLDDSDNKYLLRQMIGQARLGIQQVQDAVRQLEPLEIDLPLKDRVKRVVNDVLQETGRIILFSVKGSEPPLNKQTVYSFVRCLQELLTCSIHTGDAENIRVTLQYTDGFLELRLEDDGTGTEEERLNAGLTAVHEQMSLVKGEFSLTSFLGKGITAVCRAPWSKIKEEQTIRVLVADSHLLVRESLVTLLSMQNGIEVIGHTEERQEAVRLCQGQLPDVILLDAKMDIAEEVRLTPQLNQACPSARIIIMTNRDDVNEAVESIHAGAEGYIGKTTPTEELATKIRLVHMGETIILQSVAKQLIWNTKTSGEKQGKLEKWKRQYGLTDREIDVLKLLADGSKYKEISDKLFLAEGTVRNYISSIYSKLDVKGRNEAVVLAAEGGLVQRNIE